MPSGDHDMGHEHGRDDEAEEIAALEDASGTAFDRMWLQLMIKHHEGAVAMAKTQLAQGRAPTPRRSQAVIDGQTKEIATMSALLKTSL